MTNDYSRFGLYRMIVDHEFGYYERLLRSMEEHLRSDQEAFWSTIDREAANILDREERNDFYVFHLEEDHEFDHLRQLSMNAIFVASIALFEFKASQLCRYAKAKSGSPIDGRNTGRSTLEAIKNCLTECGVQDLFGTATWNEITNYYRIRNSIVHGGGSVATTDKVAAYAKRKQIVHQSAPILKIESAGEKPPFNLELTQSFCEEALSTLQLLLHEVFKACDKTV